MVRVADADLVDQASLIVEVEILGHAVPQDASAIATHYRAAVLDVIAGTWDDDVLIVSLPGGWAANGWQAIIPGIPSFQGGQRLWLMLNPGSSQSTFQPLHVIQGIFYPQVIEGRELLIRRFDDVHEFPSRNGQELTPEEGRDARAFAHWIRDRRAGILRAADYLVELPTGARAPIEKFTVFTWNGRTVRWPRFDEGVSVSWHSHRDGQPGLAGGGHGEVAAALNAWNNDAATPIRLTYAGQTDEATGLGRPGRFNTALFDDPNEELGDDFDCNSGGLLAFGMWWTDGSIHSWNGETWATITAGDFVTNKNIACYFGGPADAVELFTHEIGHTLGLNHSCGDEASGSCNTTAKNEAIMRATLHGDQRGGRLGSDDRAGIAFLYAEPASPPAAPSGLMAVAAGSGDIDLSWSDNSNNESAFLIERRIGGGSFRQLASVAANTRVYRDSDVDSGTMLSYRVRATNASGASGYSNIATVTSAGEPPPANLVVEALSATSVRVSWTDVAENESGYELQYDGFGTYFPVDPVPAETTEAVIDGLWPATSYTFRIRSLGGDRGPSSYSSASLTTPDGSPEACQPDARTLCLNRGRFRVQVVWKDFDSNRGFGTPVATPATDSGLFWFFVPNNWEMLVKVLDGCGFNDHFWVFAAATTDVEYTLVTGDTETGAVSVHRNPLGVAAPAITDISALPVCSPNPAAGPIHHRPVDASELRPSPAVSQLESVTQVECPDSDSTLCLRQGRFRVEVEWQDFQGNLGSARVVPLEVASEDSGLLWFFSPGNWEMLVKVLDGCGFNNHYWMFAAATTNVAYTLRVTDTVAGQTRTYTNPLGLAADAITDTSAFQTCP